MPFNRLTELEAEHLRWNADECKAYLSQNLPKLTDEQSQVYINIVAGINGAVGNTAFLVHGKAGTGKTFLLKLVLAYVVIQLFFSFN